MNKVQMIGNLTKDPELKTTSSGISVLACSIATNESYTNKESGEKVKITDYHNFVIWRKQAEIFAKYTKKGKKVYIEGKLKTRMYETQDGIKKYVTEIMVDNFEFLSPADNDEQRQTSTQTSTQTQKEYQQPEEEEINIEDIPF